MNLYIQKYATTPRTADEHAYTPKHHPGNDDVSVTSVGFIYTTVFFAASEIMIEKSVDISKKKTKKKTTQSSC